MTETALEFALEMVGELRNPETNTEPYDMCSPEFREHPDRLRILATVMKSIDKLTDAIQPGQFKVPASKVADNFGPALAGYTGLLMVLTELALSNPNKPFLGGQELRIQAEHLYTALNALAALPGMDKQDVTNVVNSIKKMKDSLDKL